MIDVYGMTSPNVRKVAILLEEMELPYRLRHVSVFLGEQFSPEFLALNPMGKVPVMVDHDRGVTLPESNAILFYLVETYGGERFLPSAGAARYDVLQWLMVQTSTVGPMLGQHQHFSFVMRGEDAYGSARYRIQARKAYRWLDERLEGRTWLAGDGYSIADIATWPWALNLERQGFDPAGHPHLMAWRNRIAERPAVQRQAAAFSAAFDAAMASDRAKATTEQLDRFFGREEELATSAG